MPKPDNSECNAQVVLASGSPRRRDLLQLLGISFCIQAADVDEEPWPGEGPEALTTRLASSKALAVAGRLSAPPTLSEYHDTSRTSIASDCLDPRISSRHQEPRPSDMVVLAADTVVVLDGKILGKPADDSEATAMLDALRGRAHRVLTGVALAVAREIAWSSVVETRVWMRAYDADEVERYVRSGRPLDKAGAYGIQDDDFRPVQRIEGCHTNVVGLPLCDVRRALRTIDPGRVWGPGWPGVGQCDRCALDSTSQRPT